jgi:hypothetical protein
MHTSRLGLGAVALLTALFMLYLFLSSMMSTADMSTANEMKEMITFEDDSLLLNIVMLLLFLFVGGNFTISVRRLGWLDKLSPKGLAFAVWLWVVLAGSAWVLMSMSSPTHDSLIVTRAGIAAALDDMKYLGEDYFKRFPFQSGYVLWTELWARLFDLDHKNYIILEIINILCLAFGEWALVLTADRLFRRREVTMVTSIMLGLFIQPMIFSTFLYGNIPGFCFACLAIYFFTEYLRQDKWGWLAASGLCLALSIVLKLNNMILLVAMSIILLAHLLRGKPLRRALALILLCAAVIPLSNAPQWHYEKRLDAELGEGIPMTSWLAMGLNESMIAPGWYNGKYTVSNFHAVGMDPDAASERSMEVIKSRLEHFKEDPEDARRFFEEKILSQWNETTFQSLWTNQVRGQFMPRVGFAKYACEEGEGKVKAVMDLGVQFIYFGMLIAAIYLLFEQINKKETRRTVEPALYLIPLIFLGGFLYHALFEAKSQYVITYVTLMIPYAAWGVCRLFSDGKAVAVSFMDSKACATLKKKVARSK